MFTNYGWLQVDEDGSGHVLSGSGFGEESVEGVITATDRLVRGHLTVGLDPVFQAK